MGGVCDAHHEILPILAKASSDEYQALVRAMLLAADRKTQAKQTAEATLLAFQSKYPDLFVVADGLADPEVEKKRRLTSPAKQIGSAIRFSADPASIDSARQEILQATARAELARKSAPNEGLEWHKRTGEILAHQRLIGILLELERRSDAHRAAMPPPRARA